MDIFLIIAAPTFIGLYILFQVLFNRTREPTVPWVPEPPTHGRPPIATSHLQDTNGEFLMHYSSYSGLREPTAIITLTEPTHYRGQLLTEAQKAMIMEGINPFEPAVPINQPEPTPVVDNRRLELS